MARLKLAGDQTGKLSGVRVMKDLKNHIKAFENDIDWPISYADFLLSLLFLSLKHHNSISIIAILLVTSKWDVNIKRFVYKIDPWLASGNLAGKQSPITDTELSLTDKGGPLCADWVNNLIYAEDLHYFWDSGILIHDRQRVLIWPAPGKKQSQKQQTKTKKPWALTLLTGFPRQKHHTHVATYS